VKRERSASGALAGEGEGCRLRASTREWVLALALGLEQEWIASASELEQLQAQGR